MRDPTERPTDPLQPPPEPQCRGCGSPGCPAHIRAQHPPTDFLDFADRQVRFVASDHWSWRVPVRILVTTTALIAPASAFVNFLWWRISDLGTGGFLALTFLAAAGIIGLAIVKTARL